MAVIRKIKLPSEAAARDIGALSSNVIYNGDAGVTTTLNDKIQSIFTAIGDINSFEIAIVNALPATGDDHTIYFVPESADSTTHNEYMYIDNQWELIGTTTIDLSNYLQKSDITIAQGLTTGIPAATITVDDTTTTIYSNNKQIWLGTSSTSASVANKVATCEGLVLEPGCIVGIKFTNGSNPLTSYTLNVNYAGAIPIKFSNSALSNLYVHANETVFFQYWDTGYTSGKSWTFLFKDFFTDQEVYYGHSSTAAATKAKIVSMNSILYDFSAAITNKLIVVKFTNENTNDSPTLRSSNDATSYNIEAINEGDLYWKANDTVVFITTGSTAKILYVVKSIPTITATAGLTTGVTIGAIDINGVTTTFYAPNADNKLSIGYVENDTIYIPNNISYRLSGDSEYSGIFYFVVPPTGSGSGYYEVTNKTVQYVRWLGQTRTVPVDSYTFTQAGLYSAFINDNQLWECKRVGSSSYALSMTGPTINLLADGVAASTITLPIYDGTVALADAAVVG